MTITGDELTTIYRSDVVLQRIVQGGKLSYEDWEQYCTYAGMLGDLCKNQLDLPLDCFFVLGAQISVLKLMREHGTIANDGITHFAISSIYGRIEVLKHLQQVSPNEFKEQDQSIMFKVLPLEWLPRYRQGGMVCEDFLHINPKACIPQIAHFIMDF